MGLPKKSQVEEQLVYEVFIFNDENVLLSRATFTMFFLDSDKMKKKKEQK